MKVAVLSRTPAWYPWKNDRCLKHLAAEGHEILAVVVEKAPTLGFLRELMGKFGPLVFVQKAFTKLGRLMGRGSPPPWSDGQATAPPSAPVSTRIIKIRSHNDPHCVEVLRSLQPDLIVLRGCGIIKKPVLEVARIGTLNAHYGVLPKWRGMDVTEWAVLYGDSPAVTIHFVDTGVDTGAVLDSETIPIEPRDTLGTLADKSAALAARLLARVATGLESGRLKPQPQSAAAGRQFFVMHPRIRQLAELKLSRRLGRAR